MFERPSGPSVTPITHTSSTINEELRECFLRATFHSDSRFSNIGFPSTYAALGLIAHKLMELITQGDFDRIGGEELEEAITKCWVQLVHVEFQKLQEDALSPVPEPVKWPKYALRMVASCKAASRITSQRQQQSISCGAPSIELPKSEVWYKGYGGKLVGRLDFIRHTSSGVEVIDYKSGHVIQQYELNGNIRRLNEVYERQMLLYAALVHENEGQWPIKLMIESLVDGIYTIEYTPAASEETVEKALSLLDLYNQQAATNKIIGSPNENNCRWCRYKALCGLFLKTADISWNQTSITVSGKITSTQLGPKAFLTLDINGGNYYRESIIVRGIPSNIFQIIENQNNCKVSFGNLKVTFGAKDLLFMWNSTFWQWLE